jgi:hypothetical protein
MVVAMTAGKANMQAELNAIWNDLLPACAAKELSEDNAEQEKINQLVASLRVHPSQK